MKTDLIPTIEKFLQYSDEKLEELSQKNQELRNGEIEQQKNLYTLE